MSRLVFFVAILFSVAGGVFSTPLVHAQVSDPQERARLQAELDALNKEIADLARQRDAAQAKGNTLQGEVNALNARIRLAEAEIRRKNLAISRLTQEISKKNQRIGELETRIDKGRESLSEILRKTNEIDDFSLIEVIFANRNISDFFADIDTFQILQQDLQQKFFEIRTAKAETEKEKEELDEKRAQEQDAKYEVESKRREIALSEAETRKLRDAARREQQGYQNLLSERQKRAEQIRAALFNLRDSQGIPFGTALEYAQFASQKTGVRAALILAILSQESDMGKNVGSCLVTNIDTGDGVGRNSGTAFEQVMKAPRDTAPFLRITEKLGISWSTAPVSCPLGTRYTPGRGFGGAMGPSQFIPSTWELFKPRLSSALDIDMPDPWNARHAITATALYLQDLGAAQGGFTAERNAACRYYSGRRCDNRRPANTFYGDQVLAKARNFQENIEFLADN